MGIAEEKLAQAEHLDQLAANAWEQARARIRATDSGAPILWEMLYKGIEREVKVFAAKCSKASSLSVFRDKNTITALTQAFPVVKLTLVRNDQSVTAICTGMKHGTASEEVLLNTAFQFDANSDLRPCFSDPLTWKHLHPSQIVREVLEPVFDFFL